MFADGDADDALAGGGDHGFGVDDGHGDVSEAEAADACKGEEACGAVAAGDFFDAGLDVAAQEDDAEVWPGVEKLGLAAEGVGADGGAGGEDGPWLLAGVFGGGRGAVGAEDEGVAGVFAFEGAGEDDAGGEFGFEVLEAVDGEVDAAVEEGFVDFLAEEAFAADVGEAAVLDGVAGGADDVFFEDGLALDAEAEDGAEAGEEVEEHPCLCAGERGASGADAQGQAAAVVHGRAAGRGCRGGVGVGHRGGLRDRGR